MLDTPWGRIPAWKASALATGEMGAYSTYMAEARAQFAQIRDDCVSILADAQAKIETLQKLQDGTLNILRRLDAYISRAEARACKDAEEREQREKFAEPIPSPPGTTEDDAPAPAPAGDLHALEAKEDPDLPVTSASADGPDSGELPDPATAPAPYDPGHNPEPPLPAPSQVAQPISVSLNEAD
jgi:hypothetical protein